MNIFFLSISPKEAAQLHCDKHVVKMIIETAQMLYSAHWMLNPEQLPTTAYRIAHKNHPCSIWVRKSFENYMWLCTLGIHLCREYQHRYGEHKRHKTQDHIEWLMDNPPFGIPSIGMTMPVQAMPDEYKQDNPVLAYQTFYRESKLKARNIVRYTRRDWPEFLLVK